VSPEKPSGGITKPKMKLTRFGPGLRKKSLQNEFNPRRKNMTDTAASTRRAVELTKFIEDVSHMLGEKVVHYGHAGGFYETNFPEIGDYTHALGEAKLKLFEYAKTHKRRDLIKAATWIFLILEAESGS
jgi:hypothetical protein